MLFHFKRPKCRSKLTCFLASLLRCLLALSNASYADYCSTPLNLLHSYSYPTKKMIVTLSHIPTITIDPYPTVITTNNVRILAGIPLLMKCLTCRYLCPVCESSIMIAATPSQLPSYSIQTHHI